ncbi:alpha/beta hydrolase [Rhodoligotrophos ferricapiens]|uniref:alpha/beta hydrolase n=1 Tax=Rhodoligotrophos ferricapiens TaxID=3069264 RepID=UPI00315CCB5F
MVTPIAYRQSHSTRLAYVREGPLRPDRCGLFWLNGFKSVMTGEKASTLAQWAVAQERNLVRFDYSGHGASGGVFTEGTISTWLDEAVLMFREEAPGPRVVLGSSMGGWLALLLARRLKAEFPNEARRVHGLVLIAPAIDMTAALITQAMSEQEREQLMSEGVVHRTSIYGDGPYPITRKLIEDGDYHRLMNAPYHASVPVRIIHGEQDPDVPWLHGLEAYRTIEGEDVAFTLVKGGDHRLSDARSLNLLVETSAALCERADRIIQPQK